MYCCPSFTKMLALDPALPQKMPFCKILSCKTWKKAGSARFSCQTDYFICQCQSRRLSGSRASFGFGSRSQSRTLGNCSGLSKSIFAGVAMLVLNNIEGSLEILEDFVAKNPEIVGVQLFSRHLGLSVADQTFRPIFAKCEELDIPIWLHPVFDNRKPDNNIVFHGNTSRVRLCYNWFRLVSSKIFLI